MEGWRGGQERGREGGEGEGKKGMKHEGTCKKVKLLTLWNVHDCYGNSRYDIIH